MEKKRFTITSALLYANGPIHLGHLAGAYLPADIFARYQKLKGHDVAFICGSDEHGAAITLQAKKDNVSPKEIVDKYHELNKKSFKEFGINFSFYDRTSSAEHHENAQEIFTLLEKNNSFTKKTSQQFYDETNKQFLADRYIIGTCPKCSNEEAYGDQCEKCGSALSPEELINPKSSLSGEAPILKETTHWYLPMQRHEEWLKEWINNGEFNQKRNHDPKSWKSQVIGQCNSWIESGLKERSMTRDLDWGVKVPVENNEEKVLYVWLDAPIGYITATKKFAKKQGVDWKRYWKNNESEIIHFIGKDNIVFHCIIFPIILKELGGYNLPTNVPANAFLNLEGRKLSTSKNWAIWLHEYLTDFKNQQDTLRYVLCATAPESKDTDFTWKDFQARNNNELVAVFGNFINRVMVLTNKYWEGVVPERSQLTKYDNQILDSIKEYPKRIGDSIEKYRLREALNELMNLARTGNKYLAETEPWKCKKTDEERTKTIINVSIQISAALAVLCEPFLPYTSKKLKTLLNMKEIIWDDISASMIPDLQKIKKHEHLFTKIEDHEIEKQLEKLNN
ncbi:MAG: methionine--tRNA ligase [Flavobacteriales bacterium]|nr:methionine--tRNA ligase [Flavobacteriales bacterium]